MPGNSNVPERFPGDESGSMGGTSRFVSLLDIYSGYIRDGCLNCLGVK